MSGMEDMHIMEGNNNTGSGSVTAENRKKRSRTAVKILIWIAAIWAVILIAIQVALSPAVLTRLADKFSSQYIDADVEFGKVSLSVIRNFPNVRVTFDTVSVTYPSERFAVMEKKSGMRRIPGRGSDADTLMSFSSFSASVNIAALAAGQIRIPSLTLDKPRIFARSYDRQTSNWDIFKTSGNGDDTTSSTMPKIVLGKIHFSDRPHIVYNSLEDTVSLVLDMKQMQFNGRLSLDNPDRKRIDFTLDSMFLAGRFPADTVALTLDRFRIAASRRNIRAEAGATTYLATRSYGRVQIPVRFSSFLNFPKDTIPSVSLKRFKAEVAGIPLYADIDLKFDNSRGIYVKGDARIEKCRISDVLKYMNRTVWKEASEIRTDAIINMTASCDGYYSKEAGTVPRITARIEIPESSIGHRAIGEKNRLRLDAGISSQDGKTITAVLDGFGIKGKGLDISAEGSAEDILGQDPLFDINAGLQMHLDTIGRMLKPGSGLRARGNMNAGIKGKIRLSQIDPYLFSRSDVSGFIRSDSLDFSSEKDSADIYLDSLDIWFGAVGNTRDTSIAQGERMIAVVAAVDSARISYRNQLLVGKRLSLKAQNSTEILNPEDSSGFYPFGGRLEIGFMSLLGKDTTALVIAGSDNIFKISPKPGNPDIPVLTLDSGSSMIFMRNPVNRIGLRDFDVHATAAMNSIERRQKAKAFIDSLSRKYPDIPRDSLFIHLMKQKGRTIPEWLTEDDFRKKDIQFQIDSSIMKIFREWDAYGDLSLRRAYVISPYFPLRNRIDSLDARFSNNGIDLGGIKMTSGTSSLSARGKLTGLRGAVSGRGILGLDLEISSDSLNVNELLGAYAVGAEYVPEVTVDSTDLTGTEDSSYRESIVTDTLANASADIETSLLVIPSNINARISLDARNVKYASLAISRMTSDITVKERCIQLTNTSARSEIGNIGFEGFYATRTKKDLKTGFDLSLKDITAEKVIEMVPAVDSIIPLLKSFKGQLNCEMAATASLDTSMNIIIPSINGVIRIGGSDLTVKENEAFYQIARKLKFKDRHTGYIDNMSVEGVIKDNVLEIFPFILNVDRYTMAMSGIQNLDMSFRYHISVLDSPIPFRVGIDLYGDNFDDFKFKIGKAKYKSTNIPAFSSVVDQTRLNLKESIEKIFTKGVEAAIQENERQKAIEDYKSSIDYRQAVDQQLDSLSAEEQKELE